MRPAGEYENASRHLTPSYHEAGSHDRQSWEQGYRGAPRGEGSNASTSTGAPQVKNEAKTDDVPPKKRRRKGGVGGGGAAATADVPEGAEVEYADPDGDTTRGPVFIHPPKGAVQACVRCHRIKRKCDGASPRCASCTRADVPCVFELSAATSK